jgi:epoxide hydrolase A/B
METGYALTNGIRMFYVSEGDGPLVLMCHGFPESWYSWRHQLAPIAGAGWRAVAVDMPGYGRSDKPDVTYDVVWLSECLAGFIDALGYEKAVLVGHDWGGLIVWPFARLHPDKTAGVVGINTPDFPHWPMPPTELLRQVGGNRDQYILEFQKRDEPEAAAEADLDHFLRVFFLGPVTVRKEVFTDDVIETYARDFRPHGALTPPLDYYRNMDRNWELTAHLAEVKIEVPCLMITAEGDPVLHPGLAVGMDERVPNLTTVMVADCGHYTQQEQPERTTEHILEFLGRLISG